MDEGMFHYLLDVAEREPLLFASVAISIPVLLAALTVMTVLKPVHPLIVWCTLVLAFFGFSQVFPENRNQQTFIAIADVIVSGIIVAWWRKRIAPDLRLKFRRSGYIR